jgi:hypothetical protein
MHLLYPLDRLARRRDRPVYTQTDTHWTGLGAFAAYEALMDEIEDEVPMRRVTEADLSFREAVRPGDLGCKVDPEETSLHVFARPAKPAAQMTQDNRVYLNGRRVDYECPKAGATVCVILGDSFAHKMLPFLCESFGRLVFGHITTLDRELVREVKPDIVISLVNERFMIEVPTDEGAKPLEQLAAEKRARGAVYPPRIRSGTAVEAPVPWRRRS